MQSYSSSDCYYHTDGRARTAPTTMLLIYLVKSAGEHFSTIDAAALRTYIHYHTHYVHVLGAAC